MNTICLTEVLCVPKAQTQTLYIYTPMHIMTCVWMGKGRIRWYVCRVGKTSAS